MCILLPGENESGGDKGPSSDRVTYKAAFPWMGTELAGPLGCPPGLPYEGNTPIISLEME